MVKTVTKYVTTEGQEYFDEDQAIMADCKYALRSFFKNKCDLTAEDTLAVAEAILFNPITVLALVNDYSTAVQRFEQKDK